MPNYSIVLAALYLTREADPEKKSDSLFRGNEEVDLKTFKISYPPIEKRYIGFGTAAVEGFKAHRVINGQVDSSLVEIKTGDPLQVDTLYLTRQKVRLLLADSVRVEIKVETARKKIRHLLVG